MSGERVTGPLPGLEVRAAAADLMAEYGLRIDEDRLEDWTDLFDAACDYKVVTRENVEQGLPNVLIWCDSLDMLRDRIASYRDVNEYNLHWARHVIGSLRLTPAQPDARAANPPADGSTAWQLEAGYSLFQTDLEGASRLFSVGRYEAQIIVGPAGSWARIRSMRVIADTALIPTLLAAPI
jgi:anthranilate 1,2-dioxygenase small subunit